MFTDANGRRWTRLGDVAAAALAALAAERAAGLCAGVTIEKHSTEPSTAQTSRRRSSGVWRTAKTRAEDRTEALSSRGLIWGWVVVSSAGDRQSRGE
jgi:hypothetical protein